MVRDLAQGLGRRPFWPDKMVAIMAGVVIIQSQQNQANLYPNNLTSAWNLDELIMSRS